MALSFTLWLQAKTFACQKDLSGRLLLVLATLWMTTAASDRGLRVGVLLLVLLVTLLAIVVKGQLQIELLLVGRKLLLHLDGGFGVTILAFLDRIALLPNVLAVFVIVMTFGTNYFVVFRVLLVAKIHRAFGELRPK